WLLPGGGVERGETVFDAVKREAREEAGIVVTGRPALHGIFANEDHFRGDHVACFIVREFIRAPWSPSFEIADARFFPIEGLPDMVTVGTRRRIAEIAHGTAVGRGLLFRV